MAGKTRVVVVDDSALMRKVLRQVLSEAGFEVESAHDSGGARVQLPPQLLLGWYGHRFHEGDDKWQSPPVQINSPTSKLHCCATRQVNKA